MLIALIFFLLSLHYLTNSRPFYARICNFALETVTLHKTLPTHHETTHLVR